MNETEIHHWVTLGMFGLAAITFIALFFITAPYGRYGRGGWGPEIPTRVSWILMEMPAVAVFIWIFMQGQHASQMVPLVLLGVWQIHYVHRTLIFPFRMRTKGKRTPITIPLLAIVFNLLNAYVNARWISHFGAYASDWLTDPRFVIGIGLFFCGLLINLHADSVLFRLRKPGETGYKVPRGGLYEFIASPNYFGEILEWTGWALMTWSLAGLSFAAYTFANLAPRAVSHLGWYRETFPEYPKSRRALIPFVW